MVPNTGSKMIKLSVTNNNELKILFKINHRFTYDLKLDLIRPSVRLVLKYLGYAKEQRLMTLSFAVRH